MGKPTGAAVAARAVRAVGENIPYSRLDCQAFVEEMVKRAGGSMAYAGSNHMFRNACTWLGTVTDAKALGKLIPGALLFIHAWDGGEPAKYRADSLGNASHVGLYCGVGGAEVVHSSASRGGVCFSTLKNGWTHVGWAKEIDYGSEGERMGEEFGPQAGATHTAKVTAPDGNPVKLRPSPDTGKPYIAKVPVGTAVDVLEVGNVWCTVVALGQRGYMMRRFLDLGEGVNGGGKPGSQEVPADLAALCARVDVLETRLDALEAGERG